MATSFLNTKVRVRGLRNNNLGNLRISSVKWQGKIPASQNTDKSFEQFENMVFGIRAMATDIANDITIKKLDTLTKLINSYAPPSENDTTNYIKQVSKQTGIKPNETIVLTPKVLASIIRAKANIENGANTIAAYYPNIDNDIATAINMLNDATKKRINWKEPLAIGLGVLIAGVAFLFFLSRK